jgi:heptosyltransferase III
VGTAAFILRRRTRPLPARPRRILLMRPDHLGDVLLSSPAVALLRAELPDAELTYLVGPWSMEVARHGPGPVALQALAFPGFGRRPARSLVDPYRLLWREARRLRAARYDLAVILRPDHWWGALLALAAGIPSRIGFDLPEMADLLTHALPAAPHAPAAEQSLRLARAAVELGRGASQPSAAPRGPIFRLSEDEHAAAARLWRDNRLGGRAVVAVQPSAGAILKSWPVRRWAAVADELASAGLAVVLAGGPGDRPLLDRISAAMATPPAAVLSGAPLGVAAATYARCQLVIGLDSGAAHLAAAVGTPTVRLYGPTDVAVFGPWPADPERQLALTADLACVPCGRLERPPCGATEQPACLLGITPARVAVAARRVLAPGEP